MEDIQMEDADAFLSFFQESFKTPHRINTDNE